MFRLVSGRLQTETFSFVGQHKLICWTIYAASTILFFMHAYVITSRFLKHDIQRIVTTFHNESLPMPVVKLQLDSLREKVTDGNFKSMIVMQFDLSLDNQIFPQWAYIEHHTQLQHHASANLIDYDYFQYLQNLHVNFTLNDVKSAWPLKSYIVNFGGIAIRGTFNATDFIESGASDEEFDYISAKISCFETDAPSMSAIGLPHYQLLPCEELQIAITLEYHTLLNRPNSPCRDDYPDELKDLLKLPMTPELLYNPIFAPNLPYDPDTCKEMCAAKHWLPKCGCFSSPETWRYAGRPENTTQCLPFGVNSSLCFNPDTPPEIISACKCYPKCNGYRFRVVAAEKIRHEEGSEFCPSKSNSSVQVRVFYHDFSYAQITEAESYPLSEFLSELVNILGLYFGFSIVSISYMIKMMRQRHYRRRLVYRSNIRAPNRCDQMPLNVVLKA